MSAPRPKKKARVASPKTVSKPAEDKIFPHRGLRPLEEVSEKRQLQLTVRCEKAHIGFLEKCNVDEAVQGQRKEMIVEDYIGDTACYRELVVSGSASVFDLTKAILVAFGLNSYDYDHRPGLGKLTVGKGTVKELVDKKLATENAILIHDCHLVEDDDPPKPFKLLATGLITGIHPEKPMRHKSRVESSVTAAELKTVKLCQLLDRPRFSTDYCSRNDGIRRAFLLALHLPERLRFCSRVVGGCANSPARQTMYFFTVNLDAVGTKDHMASSYQSRLPRCVGGVGEAYGGNKADWVYGDAHDHSCWKLAEIDCVNAKFNNGRQINLCFGGCGDPEEDIFAIANWLCKPLFDCNVDTLRGHDLKDRWAL